MSDSSSQSNTDDNLALLLFAKESISNKNEVKKIRYKDPKLKISNRPLPPLKTLAADFLRIKIEFCGICGTDLHMLQTDDTRHIISTAPAYIPESGRILGHEAVAQVVACGSAINNFKPGDWVALESITTCGQCTACQNNMPNQCEQASLLGAQQDGFFQQFCDVPVALAYNVNALKQLDHNGLISAACLEPAAVAWLACEKSGIKPGHRVAVFGAGPIGLFCAMLAKQVFNASSVVVIEPQVFRRKHAKQWSDHTFTPGEFEKQNQCKFDVMFEVSGNLNNIQRNIRKVDAGGHIILLARSGEPLNLNDVDHIITNAISISGVRGHLGNIFEQLIRLCIEHQLPLHSAVTEIIESFTELETSLLHGETLIQQQCKVLFSPSKK